MENILNIDGCIYALITAEEAAEKLKNCDCIFRLHKDGTATLIEDENNLHDTIVEKDKIGVEIGLKSVLLSDFDEGSQNRFRNNDHRDFTEWLNDKIESII